MVRRHVKLTPTDQQKLEHLLGGGVSQVRMFKRATALLELHGGKDLASVARTLHVVPATVAAWRDGYKKNGLGCLEDAPRSGRPIKSDGQQRAKITALACSQAPEGHARWTMRLLADKAVELGYSPEISHTQVANILKKTNSSPTSRRRGVWAR